MERPRILIQLDTDVHPSVFDGVVAVDAGIEHLFQYGNVKPESVRALIHGAMFTRGPGDLHRTAVFVGGSDVEVGRNVAEAARLACFDPFRVSIMHDSNGCNSTAAAAVLCAGKHLEFRNSSSLVLAGTGAVGQAVCRLIAAQGGKVVLASRKLQRAVECCANLIRLGVPSELLRPLSTDDSKALQSVLASVDSVFGCGAAGAELLTSEQLGQANQLRTAVDLNAVPPAGIPGIQITDQAVHRKSRIDYGALGVGGLKMKIHKSAIRELFTANHHFLDAQRMMEIGQNILNDAS
ncbi:MAG: NAD(P)-dependent methylenetetrahydromethanopterin dehydrogenase [Pirellulaceae bacterium]|nr:NAD(P)-dependent methylenetetrahydromethanopterin dehydrogenase [Pirellulaceae bacterium]